VHASATVDVSGVNIAVATDGYGAYTVSNQKTWIQTKISIVKTVDFDHDGIYTDLETNYAGQNASWKIVVCNNGTSPVYNITVTDTNGHVFGAPFDLAVGACQPPFIYDLVMNVDTVNNATAQGKDELGNPVGPVWDTAAVKIRTELPCPAGTFNWAMDASGNLVIVYDQFPAPNDNSYGANAVGWGTKGHTFGNLVGSDHAGFQLIDPSGVVRLSFNIDYITATTGTPSGYASRGPFGGDGSILVGTLTPPDISFDTSLARNLNNMGYFAGGKQVVGTSVANLTVDSPPTKDPTGLTSDAYVLTPAAAAVFTAPNPDSPDSPGWNFHDTYFVTINAAKLAALGFNKDTWTVQPNLSALHNSPAKPCPAVPGQNIKVGTITVKDRDVKIKLTNTNLTAKATIQSINITWPASNGQLQQIKLGGAVIYDVPISISPATITQFKGTVDNRSIDKGTTAELKFHFQNNAALTGYKITVDFGPAGSVTINLP
jgi:hypothetical protein